MRFKLYEIWLAHRKYEKYKWRASTKPEWPENTRSVGCQLNQYQKITICSSVIVILWTWVHRVPIQIILIYYAIVYWQVLTYFTELLWSTLDSTHRCRFGDAVTRAELLYKNLKFQTMRQWYYAAVVNGHSHTTCV